MIRDGHQNTIDVHCSLNATGAMRNELTNCDEGYKTAVARRMQRNRRSDLIVLPHQTRFIEYFRLYPKVCTRLKPPILLIQASTAEFNFTQTANENRLTRAMKFLGKVKHPDEA
nr:hypothetical protein HmN_000237100 [Hymenolepis microstoma]